MPPLVKFVIVLSFIASVPSNTTLPVPLASKFKSVLTVPVLTVFPSTTISSTVTLGAFNLVLVISTIVLPETLNLIVLSFAPGVASAVIFVSPSKSCTPLSTIQFEPLYPSKLVVSLLYLILPADAVGRCAVVPTGIFNPPVLLITTL